MTDTPPIPTSQNAVSSKKHIRINTILWIILLALAGWCIMQAKSGHLHVPLFIMPQKSSAFEQKLVVLENKILPIESRLARLEQQILEQQKEAFDTNKKVSPPPSSASEALSTGVIAALQSRVLQLEKQLPTSLANDTDYASKPFVMPQEDQLKRLDARLNILEHKNTEHTQAKVMLMSRLNTFYMLQRAVLSFKPYTAEYEQFLELISDDLDLSEPLDLLNSYAQEGVPSTTSLLKDFLESMRQALKPALPEDASIWQKMRYNLSSLVMIRKTGEHQKGLTLNAVLARGEAALKAGNLESAIAEIESLNVSEQAYFTQWLQDAKAGLSLPSALSQIQDVLLKSSVPPTQQSAE